MEIYKSLFVWLFKRFLILLIIMQRTTIGINTTKNIDEAFIIDNIIIINNAIILDVLILLKSIKKY